MIAKKWPPGEGGYVDGAAPELRTAVLEIERTTGSLALPERRLSFLMNKWDGYLQLAVAEAASSHPFYWAGLVVVEGEPRARGWF